MVYDRPILLHFVVFVVQLWNCHIIQEFFALSVAAGKGVELTRCSKYIEDSYGCDSGDLLGTCCIHLADYFVGMLCEGMLDTCVRLGKQFDHQ